MEENIKEYKFVRTLPYLEAWEYLMRIGVGFKYDTEETTIYMNLDSKFLKDDPSIIDKFESEYFIR